MSRLKPVTYYGHFKNLNNVNNDHGVFNFGYSQYNLEKTDPSEIERTYYIRKQQTRFY